MAYPGFNCSISGQDCERYNLPPYNFTFFTSSSCVTYLPWNTSNLGSCGWVGAPCTTKSFDSTVYSNCDSGGPDLCINGLCGGGLGDACALDATCLGDINCGNDGRCGGGGAYMNPTVRPDLTASEFATQVCITGVAVLNSSNEYECTDPAVSSSTASLTALPSPNHASPVPAHSISASSIPTISASVVKHRTTPVGAVIGGVVAAFALLAVFLWCWYKRRDRRAFRKIHSFHPESTAEKYRASRVTKVAEISIPLSSMRKIGDGSNTTPLSTLQNPTSNNAYSTLSPPSLENISSSRTDQSPSDLATGESASDLRTQDWQTETITVPQPVSNVTMLASQVESSEKSSPHLPLPVTDAQLRAENATLRSQIEALRALLPPMPRSVMDSQRQAENAALRSQNESLSRPMIPQTPASPTSPQLHAEMAALRSEIELLRTSLAVSPPNENPPPPYALL